MKQLHGLKPCTDSLACSRCSISIRSLPPTAPNPSSVGEGAGPLGAVSRTQGPGPLIPTCLVPSLVTGAHGATWELAVHPAPDQPHSPTHLGPRQPLLEQTRGKSWCQPFLLSVSVFSLKSMVAIMWASFPSLTTVAGGRWARSLLPLDFIRGRPHWLISSVCPVLAHSRWLDKLGSFPPDRLFRSG